jgi:hypothetical protein
MAQRTEVSVEEHAKRQKEAAAAREAAETQADESLSINHPLVDTELTTAEHLGKIPGEPDKKRELKDVNLEVLPAPVSGQRTREAQEEGVEAAIEAAKERTAEEEEKVEAAKEAQEKEAKEPQTVKGKAPAAANHKKK